MDNPPQLQRLFSLARELQPTILFLEDLDLYASRRGVGTRGDVGRLSRISGSARRSGGGRERGGEEAGEVFAGGPPAGLHTYTTRH